MFQGAKGDPTGWLTLQGAPPPKECPPPTSWFWGLVALAAGTIASASVGGGIALWAVSRPARPVEPAERSAETPAPTLAPVATKSTPSRPTLTRGSPVVEVMVDGGPFHGLVWTCGEASGRVALVGGRATFPRATEACTVRLLGGVAVEQEVSGPGEQRCRWRGGDWRCWTVSEPLELP